MGIFQTGKIYVFYTVLQLKIAVVERVRIGSLDNNDAYLGREGKTAFLKASYQHNLSHIRNNYNEYTRA